jgi:hypothetical protein
MLVQETDLFKVCKNAGSWMKGDIEEWKMNNEVKCIHMKSK